MVNISDLLTGRRKLNKRPEEIVMADIGDRVEILLPAYHGCTGIVLSVKETLGFGVTCSVRIDGTAETVKLPSFCLKIIERSGVHGSSTRAYSRTA